MYAKTQGFNCVEELSFPERLYVLDFAGGGAVHLLGEQTSVMACSQ